MATGKLGSSGFSNYANTSTGSADKFSASVASGLPVGSGFGAVVSVIHIQVLIL